MNSEQQGIVRAVLAEELKQERSWRDQAQRQLDEMEYDIVVLRQRLEGYDNRIAAYEVALAELPDKQLGAVA